MGEEQADAGKAADAHVDEAMQAEETKVFYPCKILDNKLIFYFTHLPHIRGSQKSDVQENNISVHRFAPLWFYRMETRLLAKLQMSQRRLATSCSKMAGRQHHISVTFSPV